MSSAWLSKGDPSSYSNPEDVKVVDIHLQLNADFTEKVLDGSVTLTVEKIDYNAKQIFLDFRDLTIHEVKDPDSGQDLKVKIHQPGIVGSKLEVELPKMNASNRGKIMILYKTSPKSTALQWLPPEQTAGKSHPYLFSQCQAIHCRSMIPIQDTPIVKSPFTAEITAPVDLTVVMSAVHDGPPEVTEDGKRKLYRFAQKIPIQSYLIAIAIGKIESRKIGPRSRVWSEKELVDQAAEEFSETEQMLQKAEAICGPYVWGIYDILVLPPSFPYGGMENPCLTFVTPTLLAGDKSLTSVIAHEISHSWTGNLVTNKNFEHFWLNEGFTVFLERKIGGLLSPHGEAQRSFLAIGGWKDLAYEVEVRGEDNPLTRLVVDLSGIDPDDAFGKVPYEKGSAFLWYLEELIGGPAKMEEFLRSYFEQYKYQSIDSLEFKNYFLNYFNDQKSKLDSVNWDEWYYSPGMPKHKPHFDDSLAKVCQTLRDKWTNWNENNEPCPFTKCEFFFLNARQKIEFLALMLIEPPLSIQKMEAMRSTYNLDDVMNVEIRFRWIRLGLRARWNESVPKALDMVTRQGRMKYIRPIYRDLYAWDDKRQLAIDTYKRNKPFMMKVAIQGVEKDLHLVDKADV